MRKALKISTEGVLTELDLDAPEGSYKVLFAGVGGMIEAVRLNPSVTMWCNEEGKFNGSELNFQATMFWSARFGIGTDQIMGDVVFTGGADEEGETLGLNEHNSNIIKEALAIAGALM
jgi:hypothetical protein